MEAMEIARKLAALEQEDRAAHQDRYHKGAEKHDI